jgi:hypothetical protein
MHARIWLSALCLAGCAPIIEEPPTEIDAGVAVNHVVPSHPFAAPVRELDAGALPDLAPAPVHTRCAWIYTDNPTQVQDFVDHVDWFEAIHPVWYWLASDAVSLGTFAGLEDPTFVAAARSHHVEISPMVASVDDVSWTRAMMATPQSRAAHIAKLVATVQAGGFDGIDLDYEHLWDNSDAAPLNAFIVEFGAAMHAIGKRASMAVPAIYYDSPIWNYVTVAGALDEAHLMVYDFHTIGTHAGPTSPVGWADAVAMEVVKTGHPERFRFGLPNYGVTPSTACYTLSTCVPMCSGAIATTTDHMLNCSYGSFSAGRSLNCLTNAGEQLFFDDTASLAEKVQVAKNRGIGGVTYWNVGGEPDGFFDMVRTYYP